MEESQEILLRSLANCGVNVPDNVSSIPELKPTTLVSICGQAINLIDSTFSSPTSLPQSSVADQVKICADVASRIKNLGYLGDISFHQFLYPSEEDLYKLIRFLVERLSESSEGGSRADLNDGSGSRNTKGDKSERHLEGSTRKHDENVADIEIQKIGSNLDGLRLISAVMDSLHSKTEHASVSMPCDVDCVPQNKDELTADDETRSTTGEFNNGRPSNVLNLKDPITEPLDAGQDVSRVVETEVQGDGKDWLALEKKETSSCEQSSKIRDDTEAECREKVFLEEVTAKASELHHLEEDLEMLKAAVEMASDNQHPVEFCLEQLKEKVNTGKDHLVELKSQWEAIKKPLEEKKRSLQQSLYANDPEGQEKLQKMRELELEKQSILSEIDKRKDELAKLSTDLEKQPKVASRKSYIERIKEITKNSRKQDADIERILKDTRELQLESNSIQERLHRTYAVVDEMVFREAKKDMVGKQAYRLLISIHESFEQISEKILATDRVRREVAQHEKKLAAMASRSLNVDKLQADLDAIRRENEHLERSLRDR